MKALEEGAEAGTAKICFVEPTYSDGFSHFR